MKLKPDAVDIGAMDIDDVDTILVDCDRCEVRGDACTDCVISVLFGAPPVAVPVAVPVANWDEDEQRAIDALIAGGLVPGLRLLPVIQGAERPETRPVSARKRPA